MISLSVFTAINILVVLPLWRWGSSVAVSHSDHFTYNIILTDLISLTGFVFTGCGVIAALPLLGLAGTYLFSLSLFAHVLLDILTCVERYMAVVHPITYRNFKNVKGVRVRNAAIGCAWLLSFLITSSMNVKIEILTAIIFLLATASCIAIVFFCSLSVLFVLIRPGPGKVSGSKRQLDETKLRAFYTIVIILAVLLLRFGTNVLLSIVYTLPVAAEDTKCHLILSMVWMTLPGSMVQPLLFIQRAGWFACCKSNK